jgi:hypothetical protein
MPQAKTKHRSAIPGDVETLVTHGPGHKKHVAWIPHQPVLEFPRIEDGEVLIRWQEITKDNRGEDVEYDYVSFSQVCPVSVFLCCSRVRAELSQVDSSLWNEENWEQNDGDRIPKEVSDWAVKMIAARKEAASARKKALEEKVYAYSKDCFSPQAMKVGGKYGVAPPGATGFCTGSKRWLTEVKTQKPSKQRKRPSRSGAAAKLVKKRK